MNHGYQRARDVSYVNPEKTIDILRNTVAELALFSRGPPDHVSADTLEHQRGRQMAIRRRECQVPRTTPNSVQTGKRLLPSRKQLDPAPPLPPLRLIRLENYDPTRLVGHGGSEPTKESEPMNPSRALERQNRERYESSEPFNRIYPIGVLNDQMRKAYPAWYSEVGSQLDAGPTPLNVNDEHGKTSRVAQVMTQIGANLTSSVLCAYCAWGPRRNADYHYGNSTYDGGMRPREP